MTALERFSSRCGGWPQVGRASLPASRGSAGGSPASPSLLRYVPRLLCTLGLIVCGCANVPPTHVLEKIDRATGLSHAVAFDTSGGPLDVSGATPETLTIVQATRLAIGSDPAVQQALAKVRQAEADAGQARLLPNPVLDVVFGFRSKETTFINPILNADLVMILNQPRRISAADRRLRGAVADALDAVLKSLADVQDKYAAVQADDAHLSVSNQRLQIIQRLLDVAKARLNVGEGTRLDVLTLDTQRVALQAEIAAMRLQRVTDRLTLARLIGHPSGAIDWKLAPWNAPNPVAAPEQVWVRTALDRRPDVQALRWELAALGDDLSLSHWAIWQGAELGPEAERDVTWWYGPNIIVPLPLFDWGQYHVKKADAAVIEGRHKLTALRRQVVEEVRRAYATFAQAQEALKQTQGELVPLEEQRHQQAEAAYRAGEADLATLLLAEEGLETAYEGLIDLQAKSSVALVELQRAVGGPAVAADLAAAMPSTRPAGEIPRPTSAPPSPSTPGEGRGGG